MSGYITQKIVSAGEESFNRQHDRLLRFPEVYIRTGLSESTIRRREANGTFPARVTMGPKMVGWYESDVGRWVANPTGFIQNGY